MSGEMISAADHMALLEQTESRFANDKTMAEVTRVGDFLPYIAIMGGNSKAVKNGEYEGKVGTFALAKGKQLIDLGKEVILYIYSWRPKTMVYKPKMESFYDPSSAPFKEVEAICLAPGAKNTNRGCGPELLVWLPEHGELAQFFFGNPTGRNSAPDFLACLKSGKRQCKAQCVLIDNGTYQWHGPRFAPHDVEIKNFPEQEFITKYLDKFKNPPASELEPADGVDARG